MRRALVLFLAVLLFARELPARTHHDWNDLQRVRPLTPLRVLLWNGELLNGRLLTVGNTQLRLAVDDAIGLSRDLPRQTVRRVIRTRGHNLPNPKKWMIIGTVAGGAIGATSGAIQDASHHENNGRWFTGGLAGAGLGLFASCAGMAAVGAVELFHHNSVVYEDNESGTRKSPAP